LVVLSVCTWSLGRARMLKLVCGGHVVVRYNISDHVARKYPYSQINAGAPPPLHARVACGLRNTICTCVLAVAGRPRTPNDIHTFDQKVT
jgi:hypothetical protein